MKPRTKEAFEELQALGVPVYEWGVEDGYNAATVFVMIWRNDDTGEVFFDDTRHYIREEYEGGRYVNPFGFRQDVHEILARYNLSTENGGMGQVLVYDEPDSTGVSHSREGERNKQRNR